MAFDASSSDPALSNTNLLQASAFFGKGYDNLRKGKLGFAFSGILKAWNAFRNPRFSRFIEESCRYIGAAGRRVFEYAKRNPTKMALYIAAAVCMIVLPCFLPTLLAAIGFGASGIAAGKFSTFLPAPSTA